MWWIYWYDDWARIHRGPLVSALEWLHVCVQVDWSLALLNVSVNGEEVSSFQLERELNSQDLRRINMQLGVPPPAMRQKYSYQFLGLITNINIYRDTSSQLDIQKMSSDPCQFAATGDLLAWEDSEWVEQGRHLEQINLEQSEVCGDQTMFNIPLVLKLNWFDANRTCHILNNGTISEMKDLTEVNSITSKLNTKCDFVWSSYVLNETDKQYRSSNTGNSIGNLSWFWDGPGNGKFVAVSMYNSDHWLMDFTYQERFCVSCNVQKRRIFTLWGVCDQSLLGMEWTELM